MTQDYKEKYPIGSQWKCRDGSRAVVVEHENYSMRCYHCKTQRAYSYSFDGSFGIMQSCEQDYALSEPWQEPRTIEGWVNVYDDLSGLVFGGFYTDKEHTRMAAMKHLAEIKITYNEQDGVTAMVEE